MAPILIDSRDIFKLGFAVVLVTMLVFAGGFFIGHHRAASFYQAGSEVHPLSLPLQVLAEQVNVDSQVPEIMEAGEEIDVDYPAAVISLSNSSKKSIAESTKASAKAESTVEFLSSQAKKNQNVIQPVDENQLVEESVNAVDAPTVTISSLDDLSKIKFSVQVGMYSRLVNAENMVKMLQAQQYDAYVTDYTNSKNEIRYNVRFGYFVDRKSANARLADFKTLQKGEGYLVTFSADNIVNIAGVKNIEQTADKPSIQIKDTGKGLSPESAPPTVLLDNNSHAGVSNSTLAVKD